MSRRISVKKFKRIILKYYRSKGRDLPWRRTRNPYRILISEVMLQQTQVSRVLTKYFSFLTRFPDFQTLSSAPLSEILKAWQGLGYNRRALSLKKLSEVVLQKYHGILPRDPRILRTLPGVGEATAGAIAVFAFNAPAVFLETNVRRVFLHFFFRRRSKVRDMEILNLVRSAMNIKNPRLWYWALMDYGAMLGRIEKENPNRRSLHYRRQSPFQGSTRQLRAKILRFLITAKPPLALHRLVRELGESARRVNVTLACLEREGFLRRRGRIIALAP